MSGSIHGIALTAAVSGEGELFRFERDGRCAAACARRNGEVEFSILYDFRGEPLRLRGAAADGEALCVRVLPQRVELWLGGRLQDEEWPCGRHFLEGARQAGPVRCAVTPYTAEEAPQPAVLGEFEGAEGWQPEENVFVGDCMPYADGGRYHVLYLKDRHHHHSKWGLGAHQWAHISTEDFRRWQIHPMAVTIDAPEEGSICTGSWIRRGDKQFLFFTIRSCDGSPARIGRSLSEDGWHFRRDEAFAMYLSERYNGASARDPKVIRDARGTYHMFLTTSLLAEGRGCLAHLTSPDADVWREEDEPIYIAPGRNEPECCDYFELNGWYYLVFSLRGQGRYLYSREPFAGWREPAEPVIPCKSVPKAAVWNGRIIFAGFDGRGQYAGTMTFLETFQGANGELIYGPQKP
ncbi:MAG: hypothetical protein J5602_07965 [Clostridia bacterium]|nr:hypothetical protein [Clostridia bacterium]